jgi:hypothetical protein
VLNAADSITIVRPHRKAPAWATSQTVQQIPRLAVTAENNLMSVPKDDNGSHLLLLGLRKIGHSLVDKGKPGANPRRKATGP